jgi:protein-disulfide isomerase
MPHLQAACARLARKLSPMRRLRALLLVIPIVVPGLTACAGEEEAPGSAARAAILARFSNIPQRGIALGAPDAPVTLTVFVDLQCPFCRDFAQKVEPMLLERYARPGKARLVLRNLAFVGPESRTAAQMAGAVGLQDHLWQFTSLVFAAKKGENSGDLDEPFLRRMAGAIPRVDVDRAAADSGSSAVTAQLDDARREAADFGIHAAPTFLLGKTGETPHVLYVAHLTPEAFEAPIDALLQGP